MDIQWYHDIVIEQVAVRSGMDSKVAELFDKVVKVRNTPDEVTEGSWGFEHTKKVLIDEVIPFINSLRATFKDFDNGLHNELNEVKTMFNQMEADVEQYMMNIVMHADSVPVNVLPADNNCLVNDNIEIERLEQENDHLFELCFIHKYNKNLMLKAELAKKEHMVEKNFFDEVVLRCSRLKNRGTNLELKLQHQKESFLNNRSFNNHNSPEILEFFKINEWQAKLNTKDVSISNLRKHIESLKGKNVVEKDVQPLNPNVIAPEMFKLDLEPLVPKVFNNRDAHIDYIKHSKKHADILREIVKHARALRPLDSDLDFACSSSKSKMVESRISNNSEPNQSWGSNASDVPSSSLVDFSEDLGRLKPKADIGIFVGYAPAKKAFRIYNKRTHLITKTIHVDFDELTAMAFEQFGSRPGPQLMTPGTVSSGLVPNPPSLTPYVPPTKKDWDILFQPMFDEYFSPLPSVDSLVPAVVAPKLADSTVIPPGVEEEFLDVEVAHLDNDPFFGVPIQEQNSKESSSKDVVPTNVHSVNQPYEHLKHDSLSNGCQDCVLNGILREEVYVSQPDGFVDQDNPNHVYKLKKALYGLKQAPQAWYDLLSLFLLSQNFSKGMVDPSLFTRKEGKYILLDSCIALTAFADADHAGCQDTRRSTFDMPLLYAVTTSNTPDPSISTSYTISSRSKWKMVWLNYTSSEQNISWQISLPRHWDEKDLTLLSTSLE
ncbi:retrovirus-related pol polyprotein from transposon TNT 1-94 [Tanacetum coccineum]